MIFVTLTSIRSIELDQNEAYEDAGCLSIGIDEEKSLSLPHSILSTDLPRETLQQSETPNHEEDEEELQPTIKPTDEVHGIDPQLLKADALLQGLIEEFHPVMYLHPQEQYRPCKVDYYLDNCELYWEDKLIANKGDVTCQLIGSTSLLEDAINRSTSKSSQYIAQHPLSRNARGRGFNLRLCHKARGGIEKANIKEAPLYARVRDCNERYFEITYITHYAFNGSYNVLGFQLGAHDCDFEHITVRVCKVNRCILYIWFGSHAYRDGYWREASQCKFLPGTNHPLVFVANHSHAIYSSPGVIKRIFGFANDHTAKDIESAIEWNPNTIILLQPPSNPSYPEWTSYNGNWCIDGIASPHNQQWWLKEPRTSNTWLRRCFFSFIPKFGGMRPEYWGFSKVILPE
jgi:hypothetical protein